MAHAGREHGDTVEQSTLLKQRWNDDLAEVSPAVLLAAAQTPLVELPSATQRDLGELQTARNTLAKSRITVLNRRHILRHPLVKRQLRYR